MKMIRWWPFAILLFAGLTLSARPQDKAKSKSIAVLAQDKAPAWADLVVLKLNTALAKEGFEPVERGLLKKVLAEHKLSASGMIRDPLKAGKLTGAGYFCYVHAQDNGGSCKAQILLVETSSGNVLDEGVHALPALDDDGGLAKMLAGIAERSARAVAGAEKVAHLPAATVANVTNKSASRRLHFLRANLRGALEDVLAARGYRVLRRQHADRLGKETTLNVSGMVRPDALVLARAADLQIRVEYNEKPSSKLAFRETPIHARIMLTGKDGKKKEFSHTFTLAKSETVSKALLEGIPKGGKAVKVTGPRRELNNDARLEAARLLAELKVLPYHLPAEDHRKTVKIAQRVVYLDPSAKDAYFIMAKSLDKLAKEIRPWRKDEKAIHRTIAAYRAYLQFPRTDTKNVSETFKSLNGTYYPYLLRGEPKKLLAAYAEEIRWHHSLGRKRPHIRRVDWLFKDRKKLLKWYDWLDELHDPKKGKSVCPFQRWKVHMALDQYKQAAECFYDGAVTQRGDQNIRGFMLGEKIKPNAQRMAKFLDQRRGNELLRAAGAKLPKQTPFQAMYGDFFGSPANMHKYRSDADRDLLKRARIETVKTEAVQLPGHIKSLALRRTPSGLWIHGCTERGLSLWHSPKPGTWDTVSLPTEATDPKIVVHTIAQFGDELMVGSNNNRAQDRIHPDHGFFALNLKSKKWRWIRRADGLGGAFVCRFVEDPDRNALLLYGDGFSTRYENGKFFLAKRKIPPHLYAAHCSFEFEAFVQYKTIHLRSRKDGKTKQIHFKQLRKMYGIDGRVAGGERYYNGGSIYWRRLAEIGGKFYCGSDYGLVKIGKKGAVEDLWYPTTFFYWQELGAFVAGNSPLPPTRLKEVIVDDKDPHLLWIMSLQESRIYRNFNRLPQNYKAMGDKVYMLDKPNKYTATYITAFNTKTGRFSKPRKTSDCGHIEVYGDHLYLTGHKVRRIAKSNWKTTLAPRAKNAPPEILVPDTTVGKASKAFFLKDYAKARELLQQAVDQKIAPEITGKMLKTLKRMK